MSAPTLTRRVLRFFAVLFLLLAAVLLLYRQVAFDRLYRNGIVSRYQNELWQAVIQFTGPGPGRDTSFRDFEQRTGVPILVFTDQLDFADQYFLRLLPTVEVNLGEGDSIFLVTSLLEGRISQLGPEDGLEFSALRLGSSRYYEPLSLTAGGVEYTGGRARMQYGFQGELGAESLSGRGAVVSVNRPTEGPEAQAAGRLYAAFRESFIQGRLPRMDFILSSISYDDRGNQLRFFYESREVSGTTYYFVNQRKMPLTGREGYFAATFHWGALGLIACVLLAAGLLFARRLRRPLEQLIRITDEMIRLEFRSAELPDVPGEMGQLAGNIQAVSKGLEAALNELKAASSRSAENEERMKLLLSDLAHEFKTPLGIISSHFEVLEKGYHEGNVEEYFEVLDDEIDRLSDMVNEVIELSKLQTGNWRIDLGVWDLSEIVRTVMQKFSKQLAAQGFSASWQVPDISVRADARRIEQVFSNLISNALKYSDSRRLLSVTAEVGDGESVTVFVRNSGQLSETERDRIWDRYYSTGLATKARLPSEGIGLDIVKTILVSHSSRYGVIQQGDMVCFYFSLSVDSTPAPLLEEC